MGQVQPVAVCTVCGAVSYNPTLINGPCGRMVGRKRCRGLNGSALNESDWAVCDDCAGDGFSGDARCQRCDGVGWLFVRR